MVGLELSDNDRVSYLTLPLNVPGVAAAVVIPPPVPFKAAVCAKKLLVTLL